MIKFYKSNTRKNWVPVKLKLSKEEIKFNNWPEFQAFVTEIPKGRNCPIVLNLNKTPINPKCLTDEKADQIFKAIEAFQNNN